MIIGFLGEPSPALLAYLSAVLGGDSAVGVATRGDDGLWMPHPDVVVVRDLSLLGAGPNAPVAPPGTPVVITADGTAVEPFASLDGLEVVTVSLSSGATVSGAEPEFSRTGTRFEVRARGDVHHAEIRALGESAVLDALIALGVGAAVGAPVDDALARLAEVVVGDPWNMELTTRADGVTVVNDAHEAEPQSMAAALKLLTLMTYGVSRAVAVLGELSVDDADSRDEHDRIGRLVVRLNVGKLIVVGHGARHIHNAAGLEGSWDGESVLVDTAEEAYDLLESELRGGDVVLVKSSKLAGLGILGDRLGGKTA